MDAYEFMQQEAQMRPKQASDTCYVCFESRHTGACARAGCPQARRVPRKAPDFVEAPPPAPISYRTPNDMMVTLSNVRCEACGISLAPKVAKDSHGELTCPCGHTYSYDLREPAPTDRAIANSFANVPGTCPDLDQEPPHPDEAAYRASVEALLADRGKTHGDFTDNAYYGQQLRSLFRGSPGWGRASLRTKEALDYIACKLSRVLSGMPNETQHWEDIAGYATLVAKPKIQ